MARITCKLLGLALLAVGVLGFVVPDALGAHLSPGHSIVHLFSGAVAAFLAWRGSERAVRTFALIFGLVYGLLGVAGFVLGAPGNPSMNMPGDYDSRMLRVVPGVLELGTNDHIIHVVLGILFFLSGLVTRIERSGPVRPLGSPRHPARVTR
jgi:hypothetical protein